MRNVLTYLDPCAGLRRQVTELENINQRLASELEAKNEELRLKQLHINKTNQYWKKRIFELQKKKITA